MKGFTTIISLVFLMALPLFAQETPPDSALVGAAVDTLVPAESRPAPVGQLSAEDTPNDDGESITINWMVSPDDAAGKVAEYKVMRALAPEGPFEEVGDAGSGQTSYSDNRAERGVPYYYKIAALNYKKVDNQITWQVSSESAVIGPIMATAQWINMGRLNILIAILILNGSIIYFIWAAKGGRQFYIRKIAGIEEVENAVGRATEMGRSIYYVPGINDMDDVQTLASITILGKVAAIAAENDTRIDVPVSRSMVMVTAREVVKEAYSKVGRPDSFQEDQVRYLTDDQFGYAAAIDGLFLRERPATIFLIGSFYAESLIMAETGNSIGSIQIAGTAQPAQLPFFVAACDYTLIGEEMFAASAYLSREPKLLGSLKGQDLAKAVFLIAIFVGVILESFGIDVSNLFTAE